MYILAGKKRLAEVRAMELAQASAKAKASDLPEDAQAAVTMTREATTDALGTVMRFDTPEETFTAQTLENAAAMWQALALTSWVAWDDD